MKRILHYSPFEESPCLARQLAPKRCETATSFEFQRRKVPFQWVATGSMDSALELLSREYVNLLVIDLRDTGDGRHAERIEKGIHFLHHLDHPHDLEARYGFHRIMALVSGPDPEKTDQLIAELGSWELGLVLRDRTNGSKQFAERIRERAVKMVLDRVVGKTAVAASGGGITGIFFEIGALKCLDDALYPGVNHFDMYFGISAGAVVTSVLAAGYSIDEWMAAVAGHPGGRIGKLDLRLMRLANLNFPDIRDRLLAAGRGAVHLAKNAVSSGVAPSVGNVMLDYSALVGPPLRSDGYEEMLRNVLEAHGATNDFREIGRQLFIGASDQDARRHVLFGSEGWDDVPISKAAQASLSVHPAFSAVEIKGRYYEDGAVTRTSDFVEAIDRGADLIFVIDPFVPYVARNAGTTNRRGVLYNIDQDIRSLSYTRFENTRNWVLRKHPEVSSYTFLPSNRIRHLLSRNPMDHRPYMEVWRGAYLSTFDRLEVLCHRLRGDLHAHGISIDLERPRAVAQRLRHRAIPKFEDFFPYGHVEIRTPPLCRER